MNWKVLNTCVVILGLLAGCSASKPATMPSTGPATVASTEPAKSAGKWESEIAAFEKQDQRMPPPAHPILFVGSSTIRFWKTSSAFPNLPVLNRGFGGSQIDDVNVYFDRVVARYQPSTIVFYSGDNDLAAGKSVEHVVSDMQQFIDRVRNTMPKTKLIVIGIKPSILRWNLIDKGRQANQQIETLVKAYAGGVFVNIESKILGSNGMPRLELFRIDGLHLSEKGYAILNEAVRPYLVQG